MIGNYSQFDLIAFVGILVTEVRVVCMTDYFGLFRTLYQRRDVSAVVNQSPETVLTTPDAHRQTDVFAIRTTFSAAYPTIFWYLFCVSK